MPDASGYPHSQTAIVQSGYGLAEDVLTTSTTYPVEPPSPNEIQIRVEAASLNPIDWQMWEGNRKLMSKRSFPYVPLFDIAGEVIAVGAEVTRFRIGDRVFADNEKDGGGGSEFVKIDQALVSSIPAGLGYAEAAAIPLAAQTALLTLDAGGDGPGSPRLRYWCIGRRRQLRGPNGQGPRCRRGRRGLQRAQRRICRRSRHDAGHRLRACVPQRCAGFGEFGHRRRLRRRARSMGPST